MPRFNPKRWRRDMGRARYSPGYVVLTDTNLWQVHWFLYLRDPETGQERRAHRSRIVGTKAKMGKFRAEEELRKIVKPIAEAGGAGATDAVTLAWFAEHRWKPMRECKWEDSTRHTNEEL